MKQDNLVNSVEKALSVLGVFTEDMPEWTITEIAQQLGLSYSTTFRLVSTLESNNFLFRNPTNQRFSLGLAIPTLNERYKENYFFKAYAIPYMHKIMKELGETATLNVCKSVKNNQRVCVARVESSHILRAAIRVNDMLPITSGCSGYVIMANLPPKDREYLMELEPSVSMETILRIQQEGFHFNDGQREEGIAGIAVPLFDANHSLLATIGISGASSRFHNKDLEYSVNFLKKCSKEITEDIIKGIPRSM